MLGLAQAGGAHVFATSRIAWTARSLPEAARVVYPRGVKYM